MMQRGRVSGRAGNGALNRYIEKAQAALVTAGCVAVLYLAAFYTARVHPLRREQSLEYRAHPRHQKPICPDR